MAAPTPKVEQLRAMMEAGDWRGALHMAAKFPRLGAHRDAIQRGWEALARPAFYRELGKDPDALVLAGIDALRERYGTQEVPSAEP